MTKRNRAFAKRSNTPDQNGSSNKQLKDVCELMIYFAVAATLIAWAMDRPGVICWAFRLGGPLMLLLTIGLLWKFGRRTVRASGDPRGKLEKRGTVHVVAKPHPTDASRPNEPITPSEPTRPRGFKDWIGIGVPVLGLSLVTIMAPFIIAEGIRGMVTQSLMASTGNRGTRTPVPLTGGMAILGGAVMVTIGCLCLIPSLLVIRALWKKYSSKQSDQLDERNS